MTIDYDYVMTIDYDYVCDNCSYKHLKKANYPI